MSHASQNVLLVLDVITLLELNDLAFVEYLERIALAVQDGQVDLAEGTRANDAHELIVRQLATYVLDVPAVDR